MKSHKKALSEFVTGGGVTVIALFIAYALTFFHKLVLARFFGPSNYGLVEMVFTILGILSVVAGLGLYSGFKRFIPIYKDNVAFIKGYVSSVTVLQVISSFIFCILLFFTAPLITSFFGFDQIFINMLYIIIFVLPLNVFIKSFIQILLAYKKVMISRIGKDIIFNLIMLAGILILAYFERSILEVVMLILFAYFCAFTYYLYFYHKIKENFEIKGKRYELKRWFNYSYPLLFANLVGYFLNWTDNLIIGRFLNEADLGIYAIAFSVAFYLFASSKMFEGIFLPIMTDYYDNNKQGFIEIFETIRTWTVLFSFVIGSVFILYAQQILTLLFGSEYGAAASSLQVLTSFFILANYFYFSGQLLLLEDQTKKILYGDIVALMLNLTITIYLVNLLGIVGAAIGSGFSYFFIRFIFHLYSKKYVKFKHNYKHIIKGIIATFGSAIISYYLANTVLSFFKVPLIIYAGIAGVLYGLLLITAIRYFNIIKKEDMIVLEVIERYTKLDLEIVRKILIR